MALYKSKLTVIVEGEEYKLDVIPKETSKVVVLKKEKVLREMDLKAFVTVLGQVGKFIFIAYNGIVSAGHHFTEIQTEVQHLQVNITGLCNKASLTISKFSNVSETVLSNLNNIYRRLIDHMEPIALATLGHASKLAEEMAMAALELHKELEREQRKVIITLERIQSARGDEATRFEEKKKQRKQLEHKCEKETKLIQDLQRLEDEAETERCGMKQKEDDVLKSIDHTDQVSITTMIGTFASQGNVKKYCEHAANVQKEDYNGKLIEVQRKEIEICNSREEALARMLNVIAQMMDCETAQNMAEVAEKALHEGAGALKQLAEIMIQISFFWQQMEEHCKSLAEEPIKTQIETALREYDKDVRIKIWTSDPFKEQAIQLCARWVALNSVCTEYMKQIKLAQKELYEYLTKRPTYEESHQSIITLAKEFHAELKKEQKAIQSKKFRANEEIKALVSEK